MGDVVMLKQEMVFEVEFLLIRAKESNPNHEKQTQIKTIRNIYNIYISMDKCVHLN